MTWLLRDGEVLASLEVADSFSTRLRGLVGRDDLDGALLVRPARSIHTFGMRFPLDVAFCDGDMTVVAVCTLPPRRVTRPRLRARCAVEARAGSFDRWGLAPGDRLEVR